MINSQITVFPDRIGKPDDEKVIIETREQLREYIFTYCTKWSDVRAIVEAWHEEREYLVI